MNESETRSTNAYICKSVTYLANWSTKSSVNLWINEILCQWTNKNGVLQRRWVKNIVWRRQWKRRQWTKIYRHKNASIVLSWSISEQQSEAGNGWFHYSSLLPSSSPSSADTTNYVSRLSHTILYSFNSRLIMQIDKSIFYIRMI